jgi:ribonuclease VapC
MILDTSAIVAVIANEPEARQFQEAILAAESLAISAVTVLETSIVLHRRLGAEASRAFDEWLRDCGVIVVPFDFEQATEATNAFSRYGKGQGHPAQLNICDCASYAPRAIAVQGCRLQQDRHRPGRLSVTRSISSMSIWRGGTCPHLKWSQRLPNNAAVSDIRFEKPHSLSYQPITRANPPSTTAVCVASNVHDAGQ